MSDSQLIVCPQCHEIVGPGMEPVTLGYSYKEQDGEWIRGTEQQALFHTTCWPQWKADHGVE
jgi:hypothetical protein